MSKTNIPPNKKVIWLTGLSGAGKSTIARGLANALICSNYSVRLLDGDELRMSLCKDLGFSEADRKENIRRAAEMAKLLVNAGNLVIVALISPYEEDRQKARSLIGPDEFLEVYINTPLQVCMQRDPKGLYAKVANGEIRNFTGVDAPYETPSNPELILNTEINSIDQLVEVLMKYLKLK